MIVDLSMSSPAVGLPALGLGRPAFRCPTRGLQRPWYPLEDWGHVCTPHSTNRFSWGAAALPSPLPPPLVPAEHAPVAAHAPLYHA